jgi:flavin reductase
LKAGAGKIMKAPIETDVDLIESSAEGDPSAFLNGMRKAASSVCVVTTDGRGGRFGVTVSSMTSVSTEPPSVLICVKMDNLVASAIAQNKVFCVNMLREDQHDISDTFAGRKEATIDRFSCAAWSTLETRSPALTNAASVFDCVLADTHSFGSHIVFIGRVVSVQNDADAETLVYHNRSYCKLTPSTCVAA